MHRLTPAVFALCLATASSAAHAGDNWTRFRGENGAGVSDDVIPAKWDDADYAWKTELPGVGHSSPVVWGDKVFVTSADAEAGERYLLCVDANTGKVLWRHTVAFKTFRKHGENNFASSTPAVDDKRVYVAWTTPEQFAVYAVSHDGIERWRADLGPYRTQHGGGGSPAVVNGLVVVNVDVDKGGSFVAALDAKSGDVKWRTPRASSKYSTSTPCVYRPAGGADQIIFATNANGITAVEPATGKVIWELPDAFRARVVSSPVVAGGLIFGTSGEGGRGQDFVAVRPPTSENGGKPETAYAITDDPPYVPTVLAYKDRLFTWGDAGSVVCRKALTGDVIWEGKTKGGFFGSPVCAAGKLYCTTKRGEVVVVNAEGDAFEELARNDLGEDSDATPAVAGGRMYLRTLGHLICVDGDRSTPSGAAAVGRVEP